MTDKTPGAKKPNAGKSKKETAAEQITGAPEATATPADSNIIDARSMFRSFVLREDGLYFIGDGKLRLITSRFDFAAKVRTENGLAGFRLTWRDEAGEVRDGIFSRGDLAGDGRELRKALLDGGVYVTSDPHLRSRLMEYIGLQHHQPHKTIRSVTKTGWSVVDGERYFLFPDQVLGPDPDGVMLQQRDRESDVFGQGGSVRAWRQTIGTFAIGNDRLVLFLAAAFAAPLLGLLHLDGFGFNLRGASRTGKTTFLRAAASVWGGTPDKGAAGFVRSWRASANGLEGVAARYNDLVLPLDELGLLDGAEAGSAMYVLAGGAGKERAGRNGAARAAANWRLIYLSTGELGLEEKALEGRKVTRGGHEVRFIDVAADSGHGFGAFKELHGFASAAELAGELSAATAQNFGTVGRAYLAWLMQQLGDDKFLEQLQALIGELSQRWLANIDGAGAQAVSVCNRFALAAAAGRMATSAGLTGWCDDESEMAAERLFYEWVKARGGADASESYRAVRQLAAFIGRHGASRFEQWGKLSLNEDGELVESEAPNRTVINRAGWRQNVQAENGKLACTYFLTKDAMAEVLLGLDFREAIKTLVQRKMIERDREGKSSRAIRPPGFDKAIRAYVVPASIIGMDELAD